VERARIHLLKKEAKQREKLKKLGIDYDFPGYVLFLPFISQFDKYSCKY